MIPFVTGAVEPGATVHTDGNQAYWTWPDHGYQQARTVLSQQNDPAHVVSSPPLQPAPLPPRGLLFYRLLQQAILTDPITYRSLVVSLRPQLRSG